MLWDTELLPWTEKSVLTALERGLLDSGGAALFSETIMLVKLKITELWRGEPLQLGVFAGLFFPAYAHFFED